MHTKREPKNKGKREHYIKETLRDKVIKERKKRDLLKKDRLRTKQEKDTHKERTQ